MRQLKPNVYAVGAIDWDRRLFDELIPLPEGTSYNAYLIKGSEKTALLDTVSPEKVDELKSNIARTGVEKIDYVISHHAEQDHSGSIGAILDLYPEAKVVTNPKCKGFLSDLLCIAEEKFICVEDGHRLSLGDKMLEFIYTPWVHWPETMCTYLREDRILFSCDFFGSHQATSDLFVRTEQDVYESAKRYFAEIMMPFRLSIRKNIDTISRYELDIIAPSHGPVYDKPDYIINNYKEWISDEVKNEVIIAYVSMHGSTKKMVDYFANGLIERGVKVDQFDMTYTDLGKLAISLVDAATIVIGTSTILAGPHPNAAYAAFVTNALRPKLKFASMIGSYGWGGKTSEQVKGMLGHLKAEFLEPVLARGYPKENDFAGLDNLADTILARHKELGIV